LNLISWQAANDYCRLKGQGWYLPSISEIKRVRDQTGWNTNIFYWTSTIDYVTNTGAWVYSPANDSAMLGNRTSGGAPARCVRRVIQ
jgi:hypothetical protein